MHSTKVYSQKSRSEEAMSSRKHKYDPQLSTNTNQINTKIASNNQPHIGILIPFLGYATVRDYCDSADHFQNIMRFDGDLKDVQRPWMVKSILGKFPRGAKLLEIGGGEPLAASFLENFGYDITIVDPYDGSGNGPQAYEQYVTDYPHINIVKGYFENKTPGLLEKSFDCIFSISVLEHIPHPKLQNVFNGITYYLKNGGYSIHCTDLVIAGPTTEWHDMGLREILYRQIRLENPQFFDDNQIHQQVDEMVNEYYTKMVDDLDTYYHSAQGYNLWRGDKSYEEFPFRKIVSMQTCAFKP